MGKKHVPQQHKQQMLSVSRNWSGPLPAPQDLDQYNKWIPGLGEKIANNFLTESEHRRECEREQLRQNSQVIEINKRAISAENRVAEITSYIVLAFVFISLVFGMVLIYQNRPVEGWVSVIAVVVAVLVGKKKPQRAGDKQ